MKLFSSVTPSWFSEIFSTIALNSKTAYSLLLSPKVSSSLLRMLPKLKTGLISVAGSKAVPAAFWALIALVGVMLAILLSLPSILTVGSPLGLAIAGGLLVVSTKRISPKLSATSATVAEPSLRYFSPVGKISSTLRFSIWPSGKSTSRR